MLTISCFTGGIAQTNGYLVQTSNQAFAVDAPEGFAAWISARKVRVDSLLLTHQHFDHVQDAAAIQREHGARVLAFSPFSRELTLEFLFNFATGTSLSVEAFAVDEVLSGVDQVTACGHVWKLQHIPGHSADSVVFINEQERLAFSGDVLFQGSIGRCDFSGGDMQLLLSGIVEKLMPLADDFVLYPGHGPSTTIGDERAGNPYLEM